MLVNLLISALLFSALLYEVQSESDPLNLLSDGTPAHWSFTRNGTLQFMVARVKFPETGRVPIEVAGNLNDSLVDTNLFFSDSSWGLLKFEYHHMPIVNMSTPAVSTTPGTVKTECLDALESQGYVYCGGPCGSRTAEKQGQFDAVILAMRISPPAVDWAGLGVVGNGFTWTMYPTSAGILEHEVGHNFGMGHGRTTKFRAGKPYNTREYEGFSRMAAGGS
eukprot:745687-Hanusia_phi.AAC.1